MKRPILSLRPTRTVKPAFIEYLEKAAIEAEAGETITFATYADSLAFVRSR